MSSRGGKVYVICSWQGPLTPHQTVTTAAKPWPREWPRISWQEQQVHVSPTVLPQHIPQSVSPQFAFSCTCWVWPSLWYWKSWQHTHFFFSLLFFTMNRALGQTSPVCVFWPFFSLLACKMRLKCNPSSAFSAGNIQNRFKAQMSSYSDYIGFSKHKTHKVGGILWSWCKHLGPFSFHWCEIFLLPLQAVIMQLHTVFGVLRVGSM